MAGRKPRKKYKEQGLVVRRSNRFIQSKDNLRTLNQRKVIAYALATATLDSTGNPTSSFPVGDLTKYKGLDAKNISRTFKEMEKNPDINRTIVIPAKDGGFELIGMIDSLKYSPSKGEVTVRFTQAIGEHIFDIAEGYTTNTISNLFLFRHTSSYRIYELLSIKEYALNEYETAYVTYDLCELKRMLGLVHKKHDYQEEKLRKELKREPTAREFFEAYPDAEPYPVWADFRRHILDNAKKEFQMLADSGEQIFTFDYSTVKVNKGKVYKVKFTITPPKVKKTYDNNDSSKDIIVNDENGEDISIVSSTSKSVERADPVIAEEIKDIFVNGEPLTDRNIYDIALAADGDIMKVKKAYALLRQQENVNNTIGWIISAIRDGYDEGFPSDRHFDYEGAKRSKEMYEQYQQSIKAREPNSTLITPKNLYEYLNGLRVGNELDEDTLDLIQMYICVVDPTFSEEVIYAKECISMILEVIYDKALTSSKLEKYLKEHNNNVIDAINDLENL